MNARDFAIESLYTAACYADEDEWRPVFAEAVDRLITAAAEEADARAEERWGQKLADAEIAIEQQANAAQTLADELAEMRRAVAAIARAAIGAPETVEDNALLAKAAGLDQPKSEATEEGKSDG